MSYSNPETIVETDWLTAHLDDPRVRVCEVDVDVYSFQEGHIPGAVGWNWSTQLCDTVTRDILSKAAFEKLMTEAGIAPDMTVVLYGDNSNWFAAWAFWQMKVYGHHDVRLLNGGRRKWLAEGRPLTLEAAEVEHGQPYEAKDANLSLRALLPEVRSAAERKDAALIDVRSPDEYSGRILAPIGLPETCQRGGHIPSAQSVPWEAACQVDGTFKSYDDLKALYDRAGVLPDRPAIAYCRIGERSSHTWFVLKYLLGVEAAKNYDGSWTEWGNLVGAPVERGAK